MMLLSCLHMLCARACDDAIAFSFASAKFPTKLARARVPYKLDKFAHRVLDWTSGVSGGHICYKQTQHLAAKL